MKAVDVINQNQHRNKMLNYLKERLLEVRDLIFEKELEIKKALMFRNIESALTINQLKKQKESLIEKYAELLHKRDEVLSERAS